MINLAETAPYPVYTGKTRSRRVFEHQAGPDPQPELAGMRAMGQPTPPVRPPCLCGCGEYPIKKTAKYVKGHARRGVSARKTEPCDCGCGGIVAECVECGKMLHLAEFNKRAETTLGIRSRCKRCDSENSARWKDANPDKVLATRLLRDFGITLADYNALLAEQGGLCAICGKPATTAFGRPSGRPGKQGRQRIPQLVVDHDHETGKIRGLLCVSCNRGIGFLKDSRAILQSAMKYLEAHG